MFHSTCVTPILWQKDTYIISSLSYAVKIYIKNGKDTHKKVRKKSEKNMQHLTAISVYVCRPIITSILLLPFFFPRLFISLLSPPFFITISDHVLPLIAVSNSVTSRARVVCVSPSPPSRYHVSRVDVFVSARSACIWIRSHF